MGGASFSMHQLRCITSSVSPPVHHSLYLAILVCTWLYLAVPGCTRLYLSVPDCTRLYQAVHGLTWLYLAVSGSTRLYQAVPGCTWLYQAEPGCTRLYHQSHFPAQPVQRVHLPVPLDAIPELYWSVVAAISTGAPASLALPSSSPSCPTGPTYPSPSPLPRCTVPEGGRSAMRSYSRYVSSLSCSPS